MKPMNEVPLGGWNLFARVLQEILEAHGTSIGKLDDHPGIQLHKEKVRRLQKSIRENVLSFPMLTPSEIERVVTTFQLNEQEQIRLRAAVLATAIETILIDRINKYDALTAVEEILPILELTLARSSTRREGLSSVR